MNEGKKLQVIALGATGWSLRRIERETGIRRETISTYLKEACVELRPPRCRRLPSKPASLPVEVTTDPAGAKPASGVTTDSPPKAASDGGPVTTDSGAESAGGTAGPRSPQPSRCPSASACEPFRDAIEVALSRGRNAEAIWQDLVDGYGLSGAYQKRQALHP